MFFSFFTPLNFRQNFYILQKSGAGIQAKTEDIFVNRPEGKENKFNELLCNI
jgi:hypothetical protein